MYYISALQSLQGLPGHGSSLQFSVSLSSPSQSAPPLPGGGLLHSLFLSRVPPPQGASHEVQLIQSDHPPSAVDNEVQMSWWMLFTTLNSTSGYWAPLPNARYDICELCLKIYYYLQLFSPCLTGVPFMLRNVHFVLSYIYHALFCIICIACMNPCWFQHLFAPLTCRKALCSRSQMHCFIFTNFSKENFSELHHKLNTVTFCSLLNLNCLLFIYRYMVKKVSC